MRNVLSTAKKDKPKQTVKKIILDIIFDKIQDIKHPSQSVS